MTRQETSAPAATRRAGKPAEKASGVEALTLPQICAAIPAECFVKSPVTSISYMVRDLGLFLALLGGMAYASATPQWAALAPAIKAVVLLAYWMLSGFIMWCCFVVGHDCGHGSFSNYALLNAVCGHLLHGKPRVPPRASAPVASLCHWCLVLCSALDGALLRVG